jgi:hypothetical protein
MAHPKMFRRLYTATNGEVVVAGPGMAEPIKTGFCDTFYDFLEFNNIKAPITIYNYPVKGAIEMVEVDGMLEGELLYPPEFGCDAELLVSDWLKDCYITVKEGGRIWVKGAK